MRRIHVKYEEEDTCEISSQDSHVNNALCVLSVKVSECAREREGERERERDRERER